MNRGSSFLVSIIRSSMPNPTSMRMRSKISMGNWQHAPVTPTWCHIQQWLPCCFHDFSFSHNHGSGKWLCMKGNYYWRDPFFTSMFLYSGRKGDDSWWILCWTNWWTKWHVWFKNSSSRTSIFMSKSAVFPILTRFWVQKNTHRVDSPTKTYYLHQGSTCTSPSSRWSIYINIRFFAP